MKLKRYLVVLVILISVFFNGCEYKKSVVNTNWSISNISFLEIEDDKGYIYNIEDGHIYKIKEDSKLLNYAYKTSGIFLKSILLEQGDMLTKNHLRIEDKNRIYELNDYYCYTDIKLSPNGSKIAMRVYSDENIFSALGLNFFTSKGEKIEFKSDVKVSGNVYNFLDDDNILYYGPSEDEKNEFGIMYKYDFIQETSSEYFDQLNGYLMKFSVDKEGFMFLNERVGFHDYISWINPLTNEKTESNKVFDEIYYIEAIGDGQFVFAAKDFEKKYVDLYKVDCKSGTMIKISDGEETKFTAINKVACLEDKVYFISNRENSESNYLFELNLKNLALNNIYKSDNILILNKSSNIYE